jgi:hypothetical protein
MAGIDPYHHSSNAMCSRISDEDRDTELHLNFGKMRAIRITRTVDLDSHQTK